MLNAGNAPDGFVITSPALSAGGWQIAFFDATVGGADSTADVTGAPAPAGRYLVTLRCADDDGTQTSRVVAVHWGR